MDFSNDGCECAFDVQIDKNKPICVENNILNKLINFIKKIKKMYVGNEKDAIDKLKKIYNCKTESCILTQNEITDAIGKDTIANQLNTRFKPVGPTDSKTWFSNIDIDSVLCQIKKKYKEKEFKHIPFQMRDFQETGGELAITDFVNEYRNGIRCFGVVFNDDKSTGHGTHWTAMFGDFSKAPFTIEHFNSTGAGPKNEIREWMYKTKHILEKELNISVTIKEVSKIQHQFGNSACGPYSLYYIISRLEGVPYIEFEKHRIPDSLMDDFRHYLFRKP